MKSDQQRRIEQKLLNAIENAKPGTDDMLKALREYHLFYGACSIAIHGLPSSQNADSDD
jgi:hypothetical protein